MSKSENELDNDGNTAQWNREFFKEEYPELSDLELTILMNIHTKDRCATGIWCASELSDWVSLIEAEIQKHLRPLLSSGEWVKAQNETYRKGVVKGRELERQALLSELETSMNNVYDKGIEPPLWATSFIASKRKGDT